MKVKRYYDGVNIEEHINLVDGVTTNTSYVAEAEVTDYDSFINKSIDSSIFTLGLKPNSLLAFEISGHLLNGSLPG